MHERAQGRGLGRFDFAFAVVTIIFAFSGITFMYAVVWDQPPPSSLEERIVQLSNQLDRSARIIGEAEQEMAARRDLVEQLAADQQRYEELTSLQEEEVEAVAQTLQRELDRAGRRSFWEQVALGVFFLFAGIGLDGFVFPLIARRWQTRVDAEEAS